MVGGKGKDKGKGCSSNNYRWVALTTTAPTASDAHVLSFSDQLKSIILLLSERNPDEFKRLSK